MSEHAIHERDDRAFPHKYRNEKADPCSTQNGSDHLLSQFQTMELSGAIQLCVNAKKFDMSRRPTLFMIGFVFSYLVMHVFFKLGVYLVYFRESGFHHNCEA